MSFRFPQRAHFLCCVWAAISVGVAIGWKVFQLARQSYQGDTLHVKQSVTICM